MIATSMQLFYIMYKYIHTGCPKKAERSIFFTLKLENIAYFDFIR